MKYYKYILYCEGMIEEVISYWRTYTTKVGQSKKPIFHFERLVKNTQEKYEWVSMFSGSGINRSKLSRYQRIILGGLIPITEEQMIAERTFKRLK